MQLRELARLNGTLREDDNRWVMPPKSHPPSPQNSPILHPRVTPALPRRILRPWQSTETRSITNTTVCTKCGGAGHIASDCKFAR